MHDLFIVCPTKHADLNGNIYLNGVDCGTVEGVTSIIFVVNPADRPRLVIERMPTPTPERVN